jgi:hypothetical protein
MSSTPNEKRLAYSDYLRPAAEDAARQLIRSWCDYGPQQGNQCDVNTFPGIHAEIARRVLGAIEKGAEGFTGIFPHFTGGPEGLRTEFIECNEVFSPRPGDCQPLLEIIAKHHRAFKLDVLTDRLLAGRERVADPAPILAEFAALEAETTKVTGIASFPTIKAGDLGGVATAADFVEGLLTDGAASVLYGPSNCGKSFWILDLAVSVATGTDFRDELEVDQGAVVYVALEGSFGVRNRIEALRRAGRLKNDTPLFLCFAPVSLLETGHAARLAETVKNAAAESNLPCRLVILDTLARSMAGGDENAGKDMTFAVSTLDAVRAATGAHVCLVHHCGKDEARGARGHSSLRAAVDTEIEVSRSDGETISTVRVTKQRDMPMGEPMPFSLETVILGVDRRGKDITSCIVRHEDSIMAASKGKAGRKPRCSADQLLKFLPADTVREWQQRVEEETGLGRSVFYEHKKTLELNQKFRREHGTNRLLCA